MKKSRTIAILAFLTLSILLQRESFAQNFGIKGRFLNKDSSSGIPLAYVNLYKDSIKIKDMRTDHSGSFEFTEIPPGKYELEFSPFGYRPMRIPEINIPSDTPLLFFYPPPCLFHPSKPNNCINGHKDGIIPIVYGLPGKKTLAHARKGKIHLGGCIVSDCDPRFYCTIPKKEL